MPDSEASSRSKRASVTWTGIALVFFFGVGLAGGAAYKAYFSDDGTSGQAADPVNPPLSAASSAPPQSFAADAPSATEQAAPDLARTEPTLAPAPTPTPAVADQAEPPSAPALAQAAPAPASSTPEPAPPAAPVAEPSAATVADAASPNADAQAATPAAVPPRIAAVAPPKPAAAAKAHRAAPQPAATPAPPSAHGNTARRFRVQFGAFAQEDNARRLQGAIEAAGLKVDISQEPGPSGHALFFVRSPVYPDYASALSAAQAAQSRAQHSANAVSITYTIRGDRSASEQRAQMP